jgi:hypothetical protein
MFHANSRTSVVSYWSTGVTQTVLRRGSSVYCSSEWRWAAVRCEHEPLFCSYANLVLGAFLEERL